MTDGKLHQVMLRLLVVSGTNPAITTALAALWE
jgi:hypothetical protein